MGRACPAAGTGGAASSSLEGREEAAVAEHSRGAAQGCGGGDRGLRHFTFFCKIFIFLNYKNLT